MNWQYQKLKSLKVLQISCNLLLLLLLRLHQFICEMSQRYTAQTSNIELSFDVVWGRKNCVSIWKNRMSGKRGDCGLRSCSPLSVCVIAPKYGMLIAKLFDAIHSKDESFSCYCFTFCWLAVKHMRVALNMN